MWLHAMLSASQDLAFFLPSMKGQSFEPSKDHSSLSKNKKTIEKRAKWCSPEACLHGRSAYCVYHRDRPEIFDIE